MARIHSICKCNKHKLLLHVSSLIFSFKSTIVLNANVAFLAIRSADTNSDPFRSPVQISSYCSVTASIGSIILGLILVRQSRTKFASAPVIASDVVGD